LVAEITRLVLHACRKIKELRETNSDIREDYKNLLRTLTT